LLDLSQPEKTCEVLELCKEQSATEFFLNERSVDLDMIADYVNS